MDYVQIGALAGRSITLDAAILRARPISIWARVVDRSTASVIRRTPRLLDLAAAGGLPIDVRTAALATSSRRGTPPSPAGWS